MPEADTILILGGGVFPDGTLTNLSRQRLDAAISLFKQGAAPTLTVLGSQKSTYLPDAITFAQTGASLRAAYLVSKGITADRILKIEDGKDTIGEAIACKMAFPAHNTKTFILVTSVLHIPRSEWLFQTILGDGYRIIPHGVPCGGLLLADEERDYLLTTQAYFRKHPENLKHLSNWHADNPALYQSFKDIHDSYHPPGKESEAYIGFAQKNPTLKT